MTKNIYVFVYYYNLGFDYVYGIGAPILDSRYRPIAAISLSGTKSVINIQTIPILAQKVMESSSLISEKLQLNKQ